jgi:hypothetical protein
MPDSIIAVTCTTTTVLTGALVFWSRIISDKVVVMMRSEHFLISHFSSFRLSLGDIVPGAVQGNRQKVYMSDIDCNRE